MTLKNIAKKVVGVLPVGSLIAYATNQRNKPIEESDGEIKGNLKGLGHAIYATGAAIYLIIGVGTNSWTPSQYKQHFEKTRIERVQKEEYKQKLFGENGYVDIDNDGKISSSERFEFCQRTGVEDKIIFPTLNLKDLEKAVKIYEVDK